MFKIFDFSFFCAVELQNGSGGCHGDPGGGLIDPRNGTLVGVSFFINGYCGDKEFPKVFSSVPLVIKWLQETINMW